MKNKILAAFVCAVTVLSLAGCGNNEQSAPVNTSGKTSQSTDRTTPSAEDPLNGAEYPFEFSVVDPSEWYYETKTDDNGESTIEIKGYYGESKRIEIPSEINGNKVIGIGSFIAGNTDITSITIPECVTYIAQMAFSECSKLSEVTFKGEPPELYGGLIHVFEGTPWLEAKKAEGPELIVIGGVLVDTLECEGDVIIPDSVKKIGNSAFYRQESITSVTILGSVTEIGEYAFNYCTNLVSVTMPDSLTEIGYSAFSQCFKLKSVNIPQSIVKIGKSAFDYCDNLAGSITLPDGIKELDVYSFDPNNVELVYKGTVYSGKDGFKQLCKAIEQNAIA
ncbi:MAG: leucine-rich repeat domain-containing protein [Oscillospiraceae bacterium]|nr:leucine-rich repeat domain-containing protein [Oscillospiraceae bacterium]